MFSTSLLTGECVNYTEAGEAASQWPFIRLVRWTRLDEKPTWDQRGACFLLYLRIIALPWQGQIQTWHWCKIWAALLFDMPSVSQPLLAGRESFYPNVKWSCPSYQLLGSVGNVMLLKTTLPWSMWFCKDRSRGVYYNLRVLENTMAAKCFSYKRPLNYIWSLLSYLYLCLILQNKLDSASTSGAAVCFLDSLTWAHLLEQLR